MQIDAFLSDSFSTSVRIAAPVTAFGFPKAGSAPVNCMRNARSDTVNG
jgi:hypothetical protein